ncbi:response regulator [Parathalassolituus penaei]|uniref:Response regulator n=1 Tax=Parathalassolituus penaei TaxID=2997323 RepID=A0A9X3EF47_9GAMM|nr:response regulator [Parathalassolituus penaei]MCY0966075.1 response regulator [Parathalassolituus penaei]
MRVLLVEDDFLLGEAIRQSLRDAGMAVDWVTQGQQALSALTLEDYQLGLLDLGLPDIDGLQLLQKARDNGVSLPVIIITARDQVTDRISGLDLGADDYLVKPFSNDELMARIRAVSRRHQGNASPLLTNGFLTLDPATREVQAGEQALRLSAREFALLHALLQKPGAILSRQQLESRIYGWNEEVESNAVEFLIHSVRRKLGVNSIRNVRGLGWMVEKPV